jgi:hypothetical protein
MAKQPTITLTVVLKIDDKIDTIALNHLSDSEVEAYVRFEVPAALRRSSKHLLTRAEVDKVIIKRASAPKVK